MPSRTRKITKKSRKCSIARSASSKPAGAEIVDPIVIPKIKELLAKRSGAPGETDQSFANYYGRSAKPPFKTPQEAAASPDFAKVVKRSQERFKRQARRGETLRESKSPG